MSGQYRKFLSKTLFASLSSAIALLTFSSALQAQDDTMTEEVVVTGYRGSLEAARDIKRDATNNIESIVAEDIGKMPDLNLAESLQRVPGIAITREGGEGRNISVRGLDTQFTRTTLNGMEVPASAGGLDSSGGVNRNRSIDFNIFASELFNRIDIHKSQVASIEEGGMGATVDLQTAKPFDNPGFHLSAGAQWTVDNLAAEADPRLTALISNTFMDDTLGVLLSFAQSERSVQQEGFGTVRYSSPDLQGDTWNSVGTVNGEFADGLDINTVFTPRLPRMDYFSNTVDRAGITAALQFRPSDTLEVGLDVVTSELENERVSFNYAAQFRDQWENIDLIEATLDPTGQYIVAGTFDGVRPRSESRQQVSTTDFMQTVLYGSYDISDRMELSAMFGQATSEHDEEQYRFNIDGPVGGDTFEFDLRANPDIASMEYGFDILDTSNYTIGGGTTIRKDVIERTNDTMKVDLAIDGDLFDSKVGVISNTREVDSLRNNPAPGELNIPTAGSNTPVDNFDDMAVTFQSQVGSGFASALNAPAGFPRDWMVQDFDVAINEFFPSRLFVPAPNDVTSFNVEEETLGAYAQVDYETDVGSMPLRLNAGLRYVETDTTSVGAAVVDGEVVSVVANNSYSDSLPAINAVLELQDDLLLRFSWGKNISRPNLANLSPRVTAVTPINGEISVGNPDLKAIRSDSTDLGIEWYFADESLVAFTWFTKEIEGFIAPETISTLLNPGIAEVVQSLPQYDPDDVLFEPTARDPFTDPWQVTTQTNSQDADLDGYEIAYQQPFIFLPGFLSNFGMIANYTHVESEALFEIATGPKVSSLPGLSEESYNFTFYYETETWGARVSTNYRDDYITRVSGSNGNAEEYNTGPTRVDLSAFYNVTEDIAVRLEVINMNEEEERNYTSGLTGDLNLVREFNSTGREVFLGATANFF